MLSASICYWNFKISIYFSLLLLWVLWAENVLTICRTKSSSASEAHYHFIQMAVAEWVSCMTGKRMNSMNISLIWMKTSKFAFIKNLPRIYDYCWFGCLSCLCKHIYIDFLPPRLEQKYHLCAANGYQSSIHSCFWLRINSKKTTIRKTC